MPTVMDFDPLSVSVMAAQAAIHDLSDGHWL
jgi:hypothetical protein